MSGSTNPTYYPTLQKSSLRLRRVYEARVTTGCTHCGAIFADARSAFRNWSAGYRDSSDNSTLRGFPRAHRTQVYIHIVKAVRIKPACRPFRPHSARAHEGVAPVRVQILPTLGQYAQINIPRTLHTGCRPIIG